MTASLRGPAARVLLCAAALAAWTTLVPRPTPGQPNAAAPPGSASVPSASPPSASPPSASAPASSAPASAQAAAASTTGTIEGTVTVPQRPQRRTLDRYAGSGNAAARTLQEVPNVVYLDGVVRGAPARPAAVEVAQQDTAFAPAVVIVPVGTTVNFPNRDPFFHNVFSYSPTKRFDLGRYGRGEAKSVVFDRPGVSKVYCEVHQFMRAAVIAVENPFHAVVDADGRFVLRDVPAGSYRLVVWDIERRPQERDVTVTAGGTVRIAVSLQ